MYQIDNQKFGLFVMGLRRERCMTQKELAERLFVSDKTVSKWERGLSMPGVSLLIPLADLLGVTVTELLKGERISKERALDISEVEGLVACSVDLSVKERSGQRRHSKKWALAYVICTILTVGEIFFLLAQGSQWKELGKPVLPVSGMLLFFGGWACLFARETLPVYYDENKISFVSDGIFRLNVCGLHFNNSNWPHILRVCRIWTLAAAVIFPLCCFAVERFLKYEGESFLELPAALIFVLSFFVPMYVVGKKYE